MKIKKYILIVALVLGVAGCAAKVRELPSWQGEAVQKNFTVKVSQKEELPLQGGIELSSAGGSMALITQHGRTLGQCVWQRNTSNVDGLELVCQASEGMGTTVQALVQRVALANYRILYAATHGGAAIHTDDYSIESLNREQGVYVYGDNSGNMEIKYVGGAQ